jgi:hypothetical protein
MSCAGQRPVVGCLVHGHVLPMSHGPHLTPAARGLPASQQGRTLHIFCPAHSTTAPTTALPLNEWVYFPRMPCHRPEIASLHASSSGLFAPPAPVSLSTASSGTSGPVSARAAFAWGRPLASFQPLFVPLLLVILSLSALVVLVVDSPLLLDAIAEGAASLHIPTTTHLRGPLRRECVLEHRT